MQHKPLSFTFSLILVIAVALASPPALADKPSWAGHDKADKHQQRKNHNYQRDDRRVRQKDEHAFMERRYFDDRHRTVINNYYAEQFQTGRCPPGLAKKHNGCMPPGLAKQWRIGYPLPRDVIYYDLPTEIIRQLGMPQPGYRYARVGSDILLMAIGTGLVVDAILGLGGR